MSQSFKRGLMILDLFSIDRPSLSLEEIANEINTSSITAYRYVKVLSDAGMLVMDEGNVKMSAKILRFVNLFWQHDHLVAISKEPILNLQQRFNETVALCKLEAKDVICIYRLESTSSLRSSFSIGQRMSIHAGAFARSIAAFLPDRDLKIIMKQIDWISFTENTIASPKEFMRRMEEIRNRGYDISKEEVDPGTIAMAVPIKSDGRAIASLGLAMPSIRFKTNDLPMFIKKLQETAQFISREIKESQLLFF